MPRIRVQPTAVSNSPALIAEPSGITGHHRTTSGKAGNRKGSQTRVTWVLQPPVSDSKERRQLQAYHRSFKFEPFPLQGTIQDGDCPVHSCRCPSSGLRSLTGSVRCLFPCTYPPSFPQVPPFYGWNFGLPIPGPSLRADFGPPGFHADYASGGFIPPFSGYPPSSVPRRLAPVISQSRGTSCTSRTDSLPCFSTGVDHQFQEIRTDSMSDLRLCGYSVSHHGQSHSCSSGQSDVHSDTSARLSSSHISTSSVLSLPFGCPERSCRSRSTWSSSYTTPPVCTPITMETFSPSPFEGHLPVSNVPPSSSLVVPNGDFLGSTTGSPAPGCLPLHRCQSGGLGGSFGAIRPLYVRPMVSYRGTGTHQYSRTRSFLQSSSALPQISAGSVCSTVIGQSISSILPAPPRGHSLAHPLRQSEGSSAVVRGTEYCAHCTASPRSSQCTSRPTLSSVSSVSSRMDPVPVGPASGIQQVRPSHSGSVRYALEQPASTLCVTGTRSSRLCDRRHVHGLGINLRVRVSPLHSPSSCSKEDSLVNSVLYHLDSTSVASSVVVQRPTGSASRTSHSSTSISRPSVTTSRSVPSSKSGSSAPPRLEVIKRGVRKAKFSNTVASLVARARRQSTSRIYDSKWLIFCRWCRSRKVDPSSPSVQTIADFLVHLFQDLKLAVSTIKGYRAMLSNTLKMVKGAPTPGSDPVISELIRSFELARPISRSLAPKWDLSVVLKALTKGPFEPLGDASLTHLTWKTVFLLTFATAKRRSEIHALSVDSQSLRFNTNGSVSLAFQPGFLAKNQLPSMLPPPMLVPSLSAECGRDDPDRLLCPVRALKFYCKATSTLRGSRTRLFLPVVGSGDISAATISRWIKATIKFAYSKISPGDLNEFQVRAHELRALSSSWAFFNHAPLEEVLSAAFWRSATTFSSFYLRSFSSEVNNLHSLGPLVAAQRVVTPSSL